MSKLGTMIALAVCLGASLIAGLTPTSSARVSEVGAVAAAAAIDPNAMMALAPHDLPLVSAPIH